MSIPKKRGPKAPKPDQTELITELISLVREQMAGQNAVLTMAMESQKANADVLAKWMGMFTPNTAAPHKSTTEEEREAIRLEMEQAEWEPLTALGFPGEEPS